MTDVKECPLCGERMRIKEREISEWIPGHSQQATRKLREWLCPECDYYEEAEELPGSH